MGSLERAAHPLAVRLIERLRERPARVLDFASGNGRNAAALRAAGLDVTEIGDVAAEGAAPLAGVGGSFVAVLSTHGMLHGSAAAIARRVEAIAERLERTGLFYATFGSVRDARFGHGERIDDFTFVPAEGDERGVKHTFFDQPRLHELLDRRFAIDSLEELAVDEIAGRWAHRERPLTGAIHWFACLTAR